MRTESSNDSINDKKTSTDIYLLPIHDMGMSEYIYLQICATGSYINILISIKIIYIIHHMHL